MRKGEMNRKSTNSRNPDKKLAAVCGLFCPSCSLFIGTVEDPELLKTMSKRIQHPIEEVECHGCRSEKRAYYCNDNCKMTKCAAEKGIDFCAECSEYPCVELKNFQSEMPHRIELWESQKRIKEAGYEKWYSDMIEHYSCPTCLTVNSAYDIACRKCGTSPSCNYVKLHKDKITQYSFEK
jgi:hypothetical protein